MAFFADLGWFPEAVIVPSRPVGGVWLRDYLLCFATCTWPTTLPSFSTATACRSKEFSSSTALQSTQIRGRGGGGGGGLTARRKRKSSLLRPPPPPLFLKVGRKKGGRNSEAVRYNALIRTAIQGWRSTSSIFKRSSGLILSRPRIRSLAVVMKQKIG